MTTTVSVPLLIISWLIISTHLFRTCFRRSIVLNLLTIDNVLKSTKLYSILYSILAKSRYSIPVRDKKFVNLYRSVHKVSYFGLVTGCIHYSQLLKG